MTQLTGMKNAVMQVTYFLNDTMVNLLFYCHIILCREKVTSYEKLLLKSIFSGKIQRFNASDESIEMLKNSKISENFN